MKRLLAGVLTAGLLVLTGLETIHHHAAAHESSCPACALQSQATAAPAAPVTFASPVAVFAASPQTQKAFAKLVVASDSPARAPPSA